MLQLLIELLPQPAQLIWIAQILRIDLFVVQPRIRAIDRLVAWIRPFAPRLRTTRPIVPIRHRGIVLGLATLVVGRLALHLLRLRTEHRVRIGLARSLALRRLLLLAGLLAVL